MAYFPQPHYTLRAPRVRLSKAPKVVFVIDNVRLDGALQKLSLTGGSVQLRRQCSAGALGELKINTAEGHLEALVELLPRAKFTYEQPFRFVAMSDSDQQLLSATIERLRSMGLADGRAAAGF
jgi:hypothetical protein